MIKKLLIANRGEIACRIIRTAKRMNIATVAVYSEIDQNALHTKMADEAICIGPAIAKESYLNETKIIETALNIGANAIHPGYGFLSENAAFAEKVEKSGLIFIGAPANAILSMGNKAEAKQIMAKSGIPLVPGFDNINAKDEDLIDAAKNIEYPLLIKASAGGGGKGMRVVHKEAYLLEAIASAKREAQSAFGDSHIILERFIASSRHVEVQIFFDQQGNGVYLFDRDCSLQRRYQKVIEEAPAPNISQAVHAKLGEAAVQAGKAVNYVGAGTVEFLLDEQHQFYFMEMNTRLQVEHPVTEMVTNTDLVEWQINIANGEALPLDQKALTLHGHAVEARLYAEEPRKEFIPSTGVLNYLKWPDHQTNNALRIETGVQENDTISPWYDPMIAKIVTWGKTRQQAIQALFNALKATHIAGLPVNRDFLITLIDDDNFLKGKLETSYIDQQIDALLALDSTIFNSALAAIAYYFYSKPTLNHYAPTLGWRLNGPRTFDTVWSNDDTTYHIKMEQQTDKAWLANINGIELLIESLSQPSNASENEIEVTTTEYTLKWTIITHKRQVTAISEKHSFTFYAPNYQIGSTDENLSAPMNGIVSSVMVATGDKVNKDDTLMTLEAMKMEISIKAPKSGTLETIYVNTGGSIEEGALLFSYAEES